jgi:hypothetical protein
MCTMVSQRCELCIEHERSHFEQFLYIQQIVKKILKYFNVHLTNQLIDFRATLHNVNQSLTLGADPTLLMLHISDEPQRIDNVQMYLYMFRSVPQAFQE